LSLETLKRFQQFTKDVNLHYYKEEYFLNGLDMISESDLLLFPAGKYSYSLIGKQTYKGYETYHLDHRHLRETLSELGNDFVIVYKNHPRLLSDFKDYNHLLVNKFGKPTNNINLAEDVIITNLSV